MALLGEHLAQFLAIVMVCILSVTILRRVVNFARRMRQYIRDKFTKKRRNSAKPDPWEVHNGYTWDYVLVVEVMDGEKQATSFQRRNSLKRIIQKISQTGMETNMVFSSRRTHVFIKIRCPLARLKEEADRINLRLPLDDVEVSKRCSLGRQDPEKGTWLWRPFAIPEGDALVKRMCRFGPFDHLHYKYESEMKRPEVQRLYKLRDLEHSIFRSADRVKLIVSILKAHESLGGCALDPSELVAKGALHCAFALHSPEALHKCDCAVMTICQAPWSTDVNTLRDYFGEKVGFYFLFLAHYTTWLILPALMGVFVWMDVTATGDADSKSVPVLCVFVSLWTTLFLEFWKRKQKTHALMWGHTEFRAQEQMRPNFKGEKAVDPVTGKPTLYFPEREYFMRLAFSETTIFGMITVVIGVVSSIFALKWYLLKSPQDTRVAIAGMPLGGIIASFANAVQIQVTNMLYEKLALYLTELENHRTETAYEDSLIAKTFMFQFVNSYASLIYIAFVKQHLEGCAPDCMTELGTTLGTIFITRILTSNVTAILVPYLKMAMERRKLRKQNKELELSPVEEQFMLQHYDVTLGPFGDYLELAIQYGYSTLFVSAFPLALLMSLVNNYLQIRADGWKLCQLVRRPEPRGAEDIGTWYMILEVLSVAAVVSNSAIIFFTGTRFDHYSLYDRAIFFIVFEHALLCVKAACALFVPDVPQDVDIQLRRQEYITSKVFADAPDDDDDSYEVPKDTFVDLAVFLKDDEYL